LDIYFTGVNSKYISLLWDVMMFNKISNDPLTLPPLNTKEKCLLFYLLRPPIQSRSNFFFKLKTGGGVKRELRESSESV
jgi:hypothetical protein